MQKYKLINKTTGEEHLCEKVVIDGFDYYVCFPDIQIATNNPNIDIPKIIDEVREEAERDWTHKEHGFETGYNPSRCVNGAIGKPKFINGFIKGYNYSQSTHPNSDDDMIEFNDWLIKNYICEIFSKFWYIRYGTENTEFTTKELLQIWREQKIKTIFYG